MADITYKRDGGRAVELYVPFQLGSKTVDCISISAVKLDHVLKWREGKVGSAMEFLSILTGYSEAELRQMRHPDSDRVMSVFFDMLPHDIVADMANGSIPRETSVSAVQADGLMLPDAPAPGDDSLAPDDGGFGA